MRGLHLCTLLQEALIWSQKHNKTIKDTSSFFVLLGEGGVAKTVVFTMILASWVAETVVFTMILAPGVAKSVVFTMILPSWDPQALISPDSDPAPKALISNCFPFVFLQKLFLVN